MRAAAGTSDGTLAVPRSARRASKPRPIALYVWVHYVVMLVPGLLLIAVALGGASVLQSWAVIVLVSVTFAAVAVYKVKLSRDIQQAVRDLHDQTEAFAQGRAIAPLQTAFLEINQISAAFAAADRDRQTTVEELNHRGKNMLAKVQSIVVNTVRDARSLPEVAQRAAERIQALKRMDDLLLSHDMRGASVRDVLAQELAVYGGSRRIALEGAEVPLDRQRAEALGLIVHELATNAAKYGGLREGQGRVRVSWRLVSGRCALTWEESGTPQGDEPSPAGGGFGTDLLQRTVAMLGGDYERVLTGDGLTLRLSFPYRRPGA
jgi:two-component sensor histidine kinase